MFEKIQETVKSEKFKNTVKEIGMTVGGVLITAAVISVVYAVIENHQRIVTESKSNKVEA